MRVIANLTGRWNGHYLQRGRESPICADFEHVGERLGGAMTDGEPDRECSMFDAACEAGLPPGADEIIERQLREALPDATGPLRYVTHLPPRSLLAGRCVGNKVTFLKTYQGVHFGGYKVGEHLIGTQTDQHAVHYEGQLSTDGMTIEGRWWIAADPARGMGRAEGLFVLQRSDRSDSIVE